MAGERLRGVRRRGDVGFPREECGGEGGVGARGGWWGRGRGLVGRWSEGGVEVGNVASDFGRGFSVRFSGGVGGGLVFQEDTPAYSLRFELPCVHGMGRHARSGGLESVGGAVAGDGGHDMWTAGFF